MKDVFSTFLHGSTYAQAVVRILRVLLFEWMRCWYTMQAVAQALETRILISFPGEEHVSIYIAVRKVIVLAGGNCSSSHLSIPKHEPVSFKSSHAIYGANDVQRSSVHLGTWSGHWKNPCLSYGFHSRHPPFCSRTTVHVKPPEDEIYLLAHRNHLLQDPSLGRNPPVVPLLPYVGTGNVSEHVLAGRKYRGRE